MATVECPLCGSKGEEGDAFCPLCGASLRVPGELGAPRAPQGEVAPVRGAFVWPDGSRMEVTGTPRRIGREDVKAFVPHAKSGLVSRTHCTVYEEGGRFILVDGGAAAQPKGSTNGTWVGSGESPDRKVTGEGEVELWPGASVSLARAVTLRFEIDAGR